MRVRVQAAYGSAKDMSVYANAGVDANRTFKVSGGRRRNCIALDGGYAPHLADLKAGRLAAIAPEVAADAPLKMTRDSQFVASPTSAVMLTTSAAAAATLKPANRFVLVASVFEIIFASLFSGSIVHRTQSFTPRCAR